MVELVVLIVMGDIVLCCIGTGLVLVGWFGKENFENCAVLVLAGTSAGFFTFLSILFIAICIAYMELHPGIFKQIWRKIRYGGTEIEDEEAPLLRDGQKFYASTTIACRKCQKKYDQEFLLREAETRTLMARISTFCTIKLRN